MGFSSTAGLSRAAAQSWLALIDQLSQMCLGNSSSGHPLPSKGSDFFRPAMGGAAAPLQKVSSLGPFEGASSADPGEHD